MTTWSRLDNRWEGVKATEAIKLARSTAAARFVIVQYDGDYTTGLPLQEFAGEDAILADRHNGRLERDHGLPVPLTVPRLCGWQSAKWVRALEFARADRGGFWKVRGHHNHADPWPERRHSFHEETED